MSKIINDGLTWSGTGTRMTTVGVKGLRVKLKPIVIPIRR